MWAALAGNVLVAVTKTGAAVLTGSTAMLAEALHSGVDTVNELLLMYGMRAAKRRPDHEHPAGYGRELYFWSFVVALLMFALGAGVSVFQGVRRVLQPGPVEHPLAAWVVLALAFVFEGASWLVSARQFRREKGDVGWYEAFRRSKDPPLFMVLLEDTAALVGLALAAGGLLLSTAGGIAWADGAASILIGLVLGATSILLARESKSLLIGEQADGELIADILRIAGEVDGPSHANGVLAIQLAPDEIMAAISVEFDDRLTVPRIEQLVEELERRVRDAHPQVSSLYVKPQSHGRFEQAVRGRFDRETAEEVLRGDHEPSS